MSQFYDQASLVMVPSGYKAGKVYSQKPLSTDGELTFTRNSNATRVNADGLVEKVRTNLALYSQSFTNAVYGPKAGTFTDNYGIAPDGTQTACRWVSTNSDPFIYQPIALNGTYTASVWIKGVVGYSGKNMSIRIGGALNYVSLTNEWQRVSLTSTQSGTINCGIEAPEGAAVGDEVLIWGFQVELSDFGPTDYIPTTSAAVSVGPTANVPRLNYSNGCPSLLLEPQRTNLLPYSEQMNTAGYWNVISGGLTVTANATTSPDGYQNADAITLSNVAARYFVSAPITIASGTSCVYSVWMKSASGTLNINMGGVNGLTGQMKTVTTEWQRFYLPFVMHGAGTEYFGFDQRGAGSSTSGTLYFWGAQVEVGSYATSYIPTLGASVTRLADAAYKTGISSLIGQTEGTLFVDFVPLNNPESGIGKWVFFLGNGTQYITILLSSIGKIRANVSNTTAQCAIDTTYNWISGTRYKGALAYKENDFAFYVNGVLIGTDNSGTIPATSLITTEYNTTAANANNYLLNQALVFKTRLTNAQLAELTAL